MKKCPCCKTETLKETNYHDELIDICITCGGLWFEKNEINQMLEKVNTDSTEETFEMNFGKPIGISKHDCPECNLNMDRVYLLEGFNTEIDICRHCDGSWIDKEELEQVERSHELKGHLDHLNKKLNWKTYLFQFLARMPVEYNLKPKKKPVVTYSLILLNTLIFMLYYFDYDNFVFVLDNYAITPADITNGNHIWTVLTAVFLHGSIMHLVGNMYFLYIIGDNLEDVLGAKRYLLVYLLLGVVASLVSYLSDIYSTIPSLGASGAIAGLFALYLMWFRFASISFMFVIYQKKLSPIWYFAIWIGMNILGALTGPDGVDQGAHIGGFVAGLVVGKLLKDKVMEMNPIIRLLNKPEVAIKR